jgi:glycine cleavage system H lipoate-binding protein
MDGKDHNSTVGRLIPSGETKCIWMAAGLIDFKLCDSECNCDECPFDQVMRGPTTREPRIPHESISASHLGTRPQSAKSDGISRVFDKLKDFDVRSDLFYHPSHTWLETTGEGLVRIGLDDFAQKLMVGTTTVVFPTPGTHLHQGEACCWIVGLYGTLPVASPVEGSVVEINSKLSDNPNLLHKDPYVMGWLLKIKPENLRRELRKMFQGEAVLGHYEQDVERLQHRFEKALGRGRERVGDTLHDGGEKLSELQDVLGARQYFEIIRSVLK